MLHMRARCHDCGVKGNKPYQIVYTGHCGVAMDGAATRPMLHHARMSVARNM
jgi:hypothetical protein